MVVTLDVHTLRRMWKPHKERLQASREDHPTSVRFHRACSWLSEVEKSGNENADFALISRWIAFNALYGQWDVSNHTPVADRECWRIFLERILQLDQEQRVETLIQEHRPLVISLLEDPYLNSLYWREQGYTPSAARMKARRLAQSCFAERRWKTILEDVTDRVYLMRCQLIHGAATFGGKLNRESLQHCNQWMNLLMPTIMLVFVGSGADENWGIMCYPPKVATAKVVRRSPK